MIKRRLVLLMFLLILLTGCKNFFSNPFSNPFGGGDDGDDDSRPSAQPNRVIEPTQRFSLAIGGVAPGRDELVLYDEYGNVRHFVGDPLVCTPTDENMVRLEARPDYETVSAGSGVRIVPLLPGVTAITCVIGDIVLSDIYEVTIPPQAIIQILVAEAGLQIADEAELDEAYDDDSVVKLTSQSPTANALGSVIRNRIEIINDEDDPSLFGCDEDKYDDDPPSSYYDEVIYAENQFSPTDPDDAGYDIFLDAENRDDMDGNWLIAYDQAVLTAAGVFNGDVGDTAGLAFAFRSPTQAQWDSIADAWGAGATEIPDDAGFTDATFPALAPIGLLIHPDVWTYANGRPSFIFARSRSSGEPAIENTP